MKRGDIYLADFGKSRDSFSFGKKRPVIIFQNRKLNLALQEGLYDYALVIPLSTKEDILTSDFRVKISKRDRLQKDSYAVVNSICFLHQKFLIEKIAALEKEEILEIEKIIKEVFELGE